MGTYFIPRNTKGESRILMVFSIKGLICTAIGGAVGLLFYLLLSMFGWTTAGLIAIGIFGLIGFSIGTFKIPNSNAFEFTRKTGGENIDDVIKRAIKFKMQHKRVYIYKEEETKDE